MFSGKQPVISITLLLIFLASACGPNAESAIATSVALTVQAQDAATSTLVAPSATLSPALTIVPTLTSLASATSPSTLGGAYAHCAKASFVSEDPPDGVIYAPEFTFIKKWFIRNDSTCVWDTTYKLIFVDGDLMGGAYVYNFPQSALPDDVIEIPIQLVTDKEVGTYKGYWKMQTPDGQNFGVGQHSDAMWVEVEVSTDAKPGYGITSVTYRLERDPLSGCATNVRYTVYALISVSGKTTVKYQWQHSDGGNPSAVRLEFTEAGSKEVSDTWPIHLGSTTGDRWFELVTTLPEPTQHWGKVTFSYLCQ